MMIYEIIENLKLFYFFLKLLSKYIIYIYLKKVKE